MENFDEAEEFRMQVPSSDAVNAPKRRRPKPRAKDEGLADRLQGAIIQHAQADAVSLGAIIPLADCFHTQLIFRVGA